MQIQSYFYNFRFDQFSAGRASMIASTFWKKSKDYMSFKVRGFDGTWRFDWFDYSISTAQELD